jgi:hypothetical protein
MDPLVDPLPGGPVGIPCLEGSLPRGMYRTSYFLSVACQRICPKAWSPRGSHPQDPYVAMGEPTPGDPYGQRATRSAHGGLNGSPYA